MQHHLAETAPAQSLSSCWDHNVSVGRPRTCSLVPLNSMFTCTNQQLLRHVCVWFSLGRWLSAAPSCSQHSCHVEAQCLWGPQLLVGAWTVFIGTHSKQTHTCTYRHLHTDCFYLYKHRGIEWYFIINQYKISGLFFFSFSNCTIFSNRVQTRTDAEDREA